MESMQTPHGLQLDDPEIYRFGCIPGGLHLDSRNPSGLQVEYWSMWGSVKYTEDRKTAHQSCCPLLKVLMSQCKVWAIRRNVAMV